MEVLHAISGRLRVQLEKEIPSEIPFYAMALHGSVYLTSPDINGQSDENTAFLKALEAGTALKYAFGF